MVWCNVVWCSVVWCGVHSCFDGQVWCDWHGDSQSLDAGDDGVEGSLDVGCGAGADHGQVVVL